MGKRNLIYRFSMLLLILVTSCISAEHYHIVSNDSTSLCQNYSAGTCFTLAKFASNISQLDQSNHLNLSFLPGEHLLRERLTITGPHNIALTGQNSSNSSIIKCQGTSGFEFRDINSLNIEYLEFTGCGNVSSGGAISINRVDMFLVNGCHFIDNHVTFQGGAVFVNNTVTMNIEESVFNNNSAGSALSNQSYCGAIRVVNGSIFTINSIYMNNSADIIGGAICVWSGNINSTNDHYINNSANDGGAICTNGSIFSASDYYINNSAKHNGGAIFVTSGNITSTNDHYISNCAENGGGAIFTNISGSISFTSDHYINNSAARYGGAINVHHGNITSTNDHYINNSAYYGGAIDVHLGNITSTSDHYINNSAHYGGVFYVDFGNLNSTSDHYIKNSAPYGGAIVMSSGSCRLCNDSFNLNTAHMGAVIQKDGGILEISQTNITDNKGNLYLYAATLIIAEGVTFMNNRGSLHVSSTQVQIHGAAVFTNNIGDLGGAITAIQQSQITFNTDSMVTISNNTATYGGGIYLTQSSLQVYHPFELTDNKASEYGGGIYASRSGIEFSSDSKQTQTLEISNNTALNGGAICVIASTIQISKCSVDFNSNIAKMNGGAMYLGQNSKISLLKDEPDYISSDDLNVRLDFTSNSAEKGGAIYVADSINDGVLCQGAECFIQTLIAYTYYANYRTLINTFFTNNTANQSGSDIYGGLLDQCTINPNAELAAQFPYLFGFDYIKATTQIEQIIDYSQYSRSHPDYLIKNISKLDVLGLISSDGILKFCLNNVVSSNYTHPNVSINKGELFTVSVAVVDEVGNPLNATVSSSLSSESGNSHFKGGQVEQQVRKQCTELEYNVYSQDNSAKLHLYLYAEGPCGNKIEVSKLTLNLTFLPCECSVGLQPTSSQTECICECDQKLEQHQVTRCFAKYGTIQVVTNIWIGLSDSTNGTGFVIHDCPYDYCVRKPVNISLNSTDTADKQCAYSRTENLCGMCKEDLSLVFGSSRCLECSSYYIFLLIPFALAGIALVAFILLLNMTVATGTIHGLIFYANILTANHSLFLPFATPNFLTVFISWLNLDLGIETCFYNGMDSYGKFLLQLAFPTYVFVLIGTTIVLCEMSKKFATLLGNRNPVAALCTLILLSYSKLIRTIITALQFTHLKYADGSHEIVWLYDANISYFTVSHIPRFIAAFIIVILGTIYTILLLFGQWFPYWKFTKWTKNTKYNAFIDAYHAPFTPRHRYWMGLLLFALTTQNIVAATTADNAAPILSAGCIALGLILLKLLNIRIYKNRLQDSLETLFLTNVAILAIATLYNIIRDSMNKNQLALANTSMAISFILFLIVLGYHFYKYILKGTRVWARVTQCCQRRDAHNRRHLYQFPPLEDEEPILNQDTLDSNNQLREPALDIIDPVYTDDYRYPPPPIVISKRPKITYTVIDNRSGHTDRDPVPTGQND